MSPEALSSLLKSRATSGRTFERPRCFDLAREADRADLGELLGSSPAIETHDTLTTQLAELVHARAPVQRRDARGDPEVAAAFLGGADPVTHGRWVYYPWRRALVHLLPEAEFRELRATRNQLHITPDQQGVLREKTVGIVGLSVGYTMAVTLALEGVGGRFRLADFDRLELSNTNRVSSGVTGLGQNKAVLAARAMFEVDPYLDIDVFEEGIHHDNVEAFFDHGGHLDLLLEECDDLPMKLRLREIASDRGVALMTETSQRGTLDIERFDLEPGRPPFHGLMGHVTARELRALTTRDKAPFVLRFLQGAERMSTTLAASLLEIERTLGGWPQLASAVTLAGGVVTDAARRVLLGTLRRSGRYQVDVESLVSDGAEAALREPVHAPEAIVSPGERGTEPVERLERWVSWAGLAPSGGNVQPWAFVERADQSLECHLSERGTDSALDFDGKAARVACGAALTNLTLAAGRDGYRTDVKWGEPGDQALYTCRFHHDPELPPDPLADFVTRRCTNRRVVPHTTIAPEVLDLLRAEAAEYGAALVVHESEPALDHAARILGEVERVRVLSESLHREMMAELVDRSDAPVGIAVDTLDLSDTDRAALDILRRRDALSMLRALDRGSGLVELVQRPVRSAGALCLLHAAGTSAGAAIKGGMAMQRVWLRATEAGLSLQPVSAGLYMMMQLGADGGRFAEWERSQLARWKAPFHDCFPVPEDRVGILIFRLFRGGAPTARSARLPLPAILRRA